MELVLLAGVLLSLVCLLGLAGLVVFARLRTPLGVAVILGGWWFVLVGVAAAVTLPFGFGWGVIPVMAILEAAAWALLGGVPMVAQLAVWRVHAREARALREHAGEQVGDGRWRFVVGTTEMHVERRTDGRGRRLLDRRIHVFSAAVPRAEASVGRVGPRRYEGVLAGEDARIEDGVLLVATKAWLTHSRVGRLLTDMEGVVAAKRAADQDAIARIQAEARGAPSRRRIDAWRTLADHLPSGLAAVAPEGLADPDPVVRVIAARALGDRAVVADVLARTHDPEAIRRALDAIRVGGWTELLGTVAARIGVPPEETWFELVQAVGQLGGRAEVEFLQAIENGKGHTNELRAAARDAHARIRARLDHDGIGRVTLVGAEGGQLALAPAGGEVSVAGPSGT
ncbi:MAG: hypothetical protein V4850_20700 [Myxococcota bacterium]